jgi:hypothetical protein
MWLQDSKQNVRQGVPALRSQFEIICETGLNYVLRSLGRFG